jgi:hypothetical protein
LSLFGASFEYVSHESSTFQMADNTHSNSGGAGGNGDGALPAPPPMTPSKAFIAAQTEVSRQILQTQQQIPKRLQQPMHNHGHNQDGPSDGEI